MSAMAAANSGKRHILRVVDHRREQATRGVYRNAEVHLLVVGDLLLLLIPGGVDIGVANQSLDRLPWRRTAGRSGLRRACHAKAALFACAQLPNLGHIDLVELGELSGGLERFPGSWQR